MDEAFSRKGAIQFDSSRSKSLSSDGDGTRFTEEGRAGQLVVYDQDMIGGQRAQRTGAEKAKNKKSLFHRQNPVPAEK